MRQLALSQPVISKAIADLEHSVGVRLLDRGPQGAEPTIYGRALLKRSVAVFDELRQSLGEIEFSGGPDGRRIEDWMRRLDAARIASGHHQPALR